jgi:hypothetical protein
MLAVPVVLAAGLYEQLLLNCHSFGTISLYFKAIASFVWKVPVVIAVGVLASGTGF